MPKKKATQHEPEFKKTSLDEPSDLVETTEKKKSHKKKQSVKKEPEVVMYEDVLDEEKLENIDEGLREIYTDETGDMPDMTRFQVKRRGHVLRAFGVLMISIIFLGAAAWFGFFSYEAPSRFSEQDVILSIFGSEAVTSGESVRYRIKFQNDQSVPLAQSTLLLRFPEGFQFVSSSIPATSDTNETWQLGTIDAGGGDVIEIDGYLYGDIGDTQSLRAFLNYTPANFSSEFQKVQSHSTTFATSSVTVVAQGPSSIAASEIGEWVFTIDNSDRDVRLELELPNNFQITDTKPAADADSPRRFTISPTATERTIVVRGMFGTAADTTSTLRGILYGYAPIDTDMYEYVLGDVSVPISLNEQAITTRMVINGAMGDISVQAGDVINTSIFVKNSSDETMEDVAVRFLVDAPSDGSQTIFNWRQILDEGDGTIVGEQRTPTERRATILWTSADVPALASIGPGEEVSINFSLPMLSSEDIDLTTFTTAEATATTDVQYTVRSDRESLSTPLTAVTINSDLRFSTLQEITSDIDGADVYEVTYALENSFHALKDIRLEVDVYGTTDVATVDVPAGEARFDTAASQLIWDIPEMPVGIDILPLVYQLRIENPNPTQTNLTSKVRIHATDSVTNERITIVGSEILLRTVDSPPDIEA